MMSTAPGAQGRQGCTIAGSVKSGAVLLPGVALTLTTTDGGPVDLTSTSADGTYILRVPGPGTFTLTGELTAFAPLTREVAVDAASCQQRIDLSMTLASRAPAAAVPSASVARPGASTAALSQPPPASAGPVRADRSTARGVGGRGQQAQPAFQTLDLVADEN